jgi:chromosome segregation ATPase
MGTVLAVPSANGAGKSSAQLRKDKAALEQQVRQLRKERDVFQKEILSHAQVIDTATAEVSEVEQALADLELLVAEQRDDVTRAEIALEGAVLAVTAAERKAVELANQQTTLTAPSSAISARVTSSRCSATSSSRSAKACSTSETSAVAVSIT